MSNCFDEKNPKYRVMFKKTHVRLAARCVSVALLGLIAVNLIQSFGRSTTVMMYSWLSACFAVGIYGSLCYGVFKEKRLFTMPFLVFQGVFVCILFLILFIFTMTALFSPTGLKKFAIELGGVEEKATGDEQARQLRGFTIYFFVLMSCFAALQAWFLEVIYRFFHFLKDRETSFTFNLDTEFQLAE
ncbi:hypothetical protein M3Y99_01193100 [Aphelenchoides fujianensis]|nr:hypothetical protein M3Y99_01193100 [Aphelenchoides fujianensis]